MVRKLEVEDRTQRSSIGSALAHEVVSADVGEAAQLDYLAQLDIITIEDLCQRARARKVSNVCRSRRYVWSALPLDFDRLI